MDGMPSIEVVYQGIFTLYNNPNPKEKEKASKWLEDFQKSIYSWTIADELLQQKRDLQSCYFAAQTMRNKIQNSFHELPQSSHESLRDSLIVHIGRITNETDPIIVTQLCLAIADLVLLMSSWTDPLTSLIEKLSQNPDSIWPLVEILTLIPEEVDSRYLRLGANRREDIRKILEASCMTVMNFLNLCFQQYGQNINIMNKVIICFNAWIAARIVPFMNLTENPIAQKIFLVLSDVNTTKKIHDSATDCLCSIIKCFEGKSKENRHDVELQIFNGVLGLENCYLAHIGVGYEDVDKAINYSRIFSDLGEACVRKMTSDEKTPHYTIKVLDLVSSCSEHYDYEVAEITFNCWYNLSEVLYEKNNENVTGFFKHYIERLILAMYRHSQMDPDHIGLVDEGDAFYDFRRKVSDLIKDIIFVIGSTNCFKQMFIVLQDPSNTWERSEAALFIMENVAKNILPEESVVVPKVIEAILNLPENTHIAVRYTSIMLLGELCDWIANHETSLQAILNFLLYGLQQKNGLAKAAAIALTKVCTSSSDHILVHLAGLIEIARNLDTFEINNETSIGLLKGISTIISKLPSPQLEKAIQELCSFQFRPLLHLVETDNGEITKGEKNDPTYWIDRACAIIRQLNPEAISGEMHPVVQILTESWPLMSQVLDKYQADLRVMERTCRFLRYGIRAVGIGVTHLLEPLVKQMVHLYSIQRHSCFLYLGSILVDEFAKKDDCTAGLLEMLKAFIEPTFNMLHVENGLKNNPDTVDDFFRLSSRFLECCPIPFLQSPLVTPILQCALLACPLDHRDANSSVMKFFTNLLKCGRPTYRLDETKPLVKQITHQHGQALVMNLIHSAVFCLHSYMLPDVAEVLNELKTVEGRENMEVYLKLALDALPKKNSGGHVTATQKQLDEFCETVIRAETTKSVSIALKDFTRLYR